MPDGVAVDWSMLYLSLLTGRTKKDAAVSSSPSLELSPGLAELILFWSGQVLMRKLIGGIGSD